MADGEKNPKLDFKNLKLGSSVKLKLDCARAVKTGVNAAHPTWGEWSMWFAFADGTLPVIGADGKVINGHTGKVIFFPSKNLNRDLEKLAAGNVEVEVKITKTAKEGQKGLLTVFEVEKLSAGKPATSSTSTASVPSTAVTLILTEIEQSFVNEMTDLVRDGFKVSKELVLKAARQPDYQISEDRAIELYTLIKK